MLDELKARELIPADAQHDDECEACVLGKQHRFSSPPSPSRARAPLDLLHSDVCGPLQVPSLSGRRYFLTVLDDCSKYAVVRFLGHKSDASQELQDVIIMAETQLGRTVKMLQSDGGGEYVSGGLQRFFADKGIVHRMTPPYHPQQNGAAERLNRTLLDRARSMLLGAHLPLAAWAEAVNAACYLRNRMPCGAVESNVPYELFWRTAPPDLHCLRAYGCSAYVLRLGPGVKKLDARSWKGRLVGYEADGKIYRVLLDDGKTVKISKHVVFREGNLGGVSAVEGEAVPFSVSPQGSGGGTDPVAGSGIRASQAIGTTGDGSIPGVSHSSCDASSPQAPVVLSPTPEVSVGRGQEFVQREMLESPHMSEEHGEALPSSTVSPATEGIDAPSGDMQGGEEDVSPAPRYPRRDRRAPTTWWKVSAASETPAPADESSSEGADGAALVCGPADEVPATFAEAIASPDAAQWREAMGDEMASLHTNNTWELCSLPAGRKAIACRWVFAIKRNETGAIERYKARLVAKGFSQKPGQDYGDVWAPVGQHKTLRTLLAVAAVEDLELRQLDIKTAFLNGDIDEELYIQQPPGYEQGDAKVCRLRKALYGLKQASRAWHLKLRDFVTGCGFAASDADPCLFIKKGAAGPIIVLVYVDDMLIAAPSTEAVERVTREVLDRFEARDLGDARLFLGMSIVRDRERRLLWLHQAQYARMVVDKFGMTEAKLSSVPMGREVRLRRDDEAGEVIDQPYAELVGSLMYLMTCTRPDLAQAVGVLSRYVSSPRKQHWVAATRVLRYVVGTLDLGLQYGGKSRGVVGYCDADYAGDLDTRRSTTGYVWLVHGGAVSWRSVLQQTVALSTSEAEYMAAAAAAREALWMRKLWADMCAVDRAQTILCDSQAALALVRNPVVSQRSKHIDVMHHFVRERADRGEVVLEYCHTEKMVADALTKVISLPKFVWCRECMGITLNPHGD